VSNPSPSLVEPAAPLLVVSRYRVDAVERADFIVDARAAIDVLTAQPGCISTSLGQATDDASLLVIRSEWVGVGAYRRALSAFDVKLHAVPLLSRAIDEPSAYELMLHWTPAGTVSAPSGLAQDAGSVALGEASAADVRPMSS
jgi:hypothetical protein